MKYLRTKFIFAGIFAGAVSFAAAGGGSLAGALAGLGLVFENARDCALEKNYTRGDCSSGKRCFSTVTASCGDSKLRFELVSVIGEEEARKYMASRFTRVKMLYAGYIEYPGMATKRREVPAELAATYAAKGPLGYEALYMPATENMAYGAGAADLVRYSAGMTYRYCRAAKELWQVEVFVSTRTPRAEIDNVLARIACPAAPGAVR